MVRRPSVSVHLEKEETKWVTRCFSHNRGRQDRPAQGLSLPPISQRAYEVHPHRGIPHAAKKKKKKMHSPQPWYNCKEIVSPLSRFSVSLEITNNKGKSHLQCIMGNGPKGSFSTPTSLFSLRYIEIET